MNNKTKKLTQAALSGLIALTSGSLTSCSNDKPILCTGVAKNNPKEPLIMNKGECAKLAGGKINPIEPQKIKDYKAYPYSSYVKCYGVAASGMNDCGTKTSACGGTAKIAKSTDAWIAFPEKLCEEVGGIVEEPTKNTILKPSNGTQKGKA
jgi:uncharacterized membrane protein